MPILTIALGVALIVAALGSLWASLNLVPTEMGLLYGVSGVILLGCGAIVLAIAALIARIVGLAGPPPKPVAAPAPAAPEIAAPKIGTAGTAAEDTGAAAPLLSPAPTEQGPANGSAAAKVVGRYAAGPASYVLFADGTIEAETDAGALRFATLDDFKSYIAARKR